MLPAAPRPASTATSPWAATTRRLSYDADAGRRAGARQRRPLRGRGDAAGAGRRPCRAGDDWRESQGIAYRDATASVIAEPPRHLAHDLDDLPWPDRDFEATDVLGRPGDADPGQPRLRADLLVLLDPHLLPDRARQGGAPAQARRGGARDEAAARRARHHRSSSSRTTTSRCSGRSGGPGRTSWSTSSTSSGLAGKVIWKINCRADAVDAELLAAHARCRPVPRLHGPGIRRRGGPRHAQQGDHGRAEPGGGAPAEGARHPCSSTASCCSIRRAPSSSVRATSASCARSSATAAASATFCKMLPYDGTPIKDALEAAGRLKGDVCAPDYDFLDPQAGRLLRRAWRRWWT